MRSLLTDFQNALNDKISYPVFFIELDFGGTLYHWNTTSFNILWNSQNWLGNGFIKDIQVPQENEELSFSGMNLILQGNIPSLIALLLNNSKANQVGSLYLALLNPDNSVINAPYKLFEGFLDSNKIDSDRALTNITLTYQNELTLIKKTVEHKFTSATQKIFYPNDLGFEYVPQMANWNGFWGKPQPTAPKKRSSGKGKTKGKK